MKPAPRHCALYTRKSTEEGLSQDFNSLDAQREACAAYVKSQSSEGWQSLPAHYDDGGYSGGTMQRPALQQLLADIAAGIVDTVVVYKIDRLTRSLPDFARMVEIFDRYQVSFVSVTQAFNTTTSMGRLTLNVLLSFAQFEREVTGERIRDKIAASKAKGMWMGGTVPLGYDLPSAGSRALIANPTEAETVRRIFKCYLTLKSVHALQRWLAEQGICSKRRITRAGKTLGGKPFSRGALFHLLRNRTYLGEIPHRDQYHPGLHPAIIEADLFAQVQARLDANQTRRKTTSSKVARAPLTGRLFDTDGHPMSPTFSYGRRGRVYRYYVSAPLQQGGQPNKGDDAPRRIAAPKLEAGLTKILTRLLPAHADDPLKLIARVEVHSNSVDLLLPIAHLHRIRKAIIADEAAEPDPADQTLLRLTLLMRFNTRGGKTEVHFGPGDRTAPNPKLVNALREAHAMLLPGARNAPRLDCAPDSPWRRRLVRLAFLAPDIQRALLAGEHPEGLTLTTLMADPFPLLWRDQARRLGVEDMLPASKSPATVS